MAGKYIDNNFYAVVRLDKDENREIIFSLEVSFTAADAEAIAVDTNASWGEEWVKKNPMLRVVRLLVKEIGIIKTFKGE